MARRSMQIDFSLRGVSGLERGLNRGAIAADRYSESLEKAARAEKQIVGTSPAFASGPSGGGRGSGIERQRRAPGANDSGVGSRGPSRSPLEGPQARLHRARMEWQPDDFDSQYRLKRAEAAYERAERFMEPKTFLDRLGDAIGTSRFSLGGPGGAQVMPLVNRVLPLFGDKIGKLIGPLGLAAAGLSGLAAQAERSGAALRQEGIARSLSGGSHRDVAALTRMGVDAGEVASRAASFRERISIEGGDPYALAEAQKRGISPALGRAYGPQNEAALYLQGMEALRGLRGDPNEQLRVARLWGMDGELENVNISDDLWERQKRGIAARAAALRESEQIMRDRDAARRIFQDNWNDQFNGLGVGWARVERGFYSDASRALDGPRFGVDALPEATRRRLGFERGATPTAEPKPDPVKDLTHALRENTEAQRRANEAMPRGFHGSASPAVSDILRLSGPALSEAIRAEAIRSGAF